MHVYKTLDGVNYREKLRGLGLGLGAAYTTIEEVVHALYSVEMDLADVIDISTIQTDWVVGGIPSKNGWRIGEVGNTAYEYYIECEILTAYVHVNYMMFRIKALVIDSSDFNGG